MQSCKCRLLYYCSLNYSFLHLSPVAYMQGPPDKATGGWERRSENAMGRTNLISAAQASLRLRICISHAFLGNECISSSRPEWGYRVWIESETTTRTLPAPGNKDELVTCARNVGELLKNIFKVPPTSLLSEVFVQTHILLLSFAKSVRGKLEVCSTIDTDDSSAKCDGTYPGGSCRYPMGM